MIEMESPGALGSLRYVVQRGAASRFRSIAPFAIHTCYDASLTLRLLRLALAASFLTTAIWAEVASARIDRPTNGDRESEVILRVQAQETGQSEIFRGIGVVTAVDSRTGALTVDHEEIRGLMPAMIMMYRVERPSLSVGLQPGDKIEFVLDAKSYTIKKIKLVERVK
jgi:Cu/Ag efflux protein CusF